MAEQLQYHYYHSPEEYKRGEQQFRELRNALAKSALVKVGFAIKDVVTGLPYCVEGKITRVFRSNMVPFVEVESLERKLTFDEFIQTRRAMKTDTPPTTFQERRDQQINEEMIHTGLSAPYDEGPAFFNLAHNSIYSLARGFESQHPYEPLS